MSNTPSHNLKVGDILSSTWGYSMTLVDFYKVTRVMPKSVEVVRIGEKDVKATGYLCGTVLPDPDNNLLTNKWLPDGSSTKVEARFIRRVDARGGVSGYNSSSYATKWDGNPVYFNHCD